MDPNYDFFQPNRPSGLTHLIRLNQSLENHLDYGIRVCQFRAGPIASLSHNWEEIGDDTIAIVSLTYRTIMSDPLKRTIYHTISRYPN